MNSLIYRLLTLGSAVIGLLAARPAAAGVPNVWAFAYSGNPTPPAGSVMAPAYQAGSFQSTCPGSLATITQIATGKYTVVFPCSASPNGIVHVTAVDDTGRYCEIENWSDSGSAKAVTVLCYKGPSADNARFTVLYTTSSGAAPTGAHAYVFSSFNGTVLASFNSAGPASSITHPSVGHYEVKLPLLSPGTYVGDLQATAVHPNDLPRRCHIDNWISSGTDYLVPISCTDPSGVFTDTWFTLSYHSQRSVVATRPSAFAYMTNLVGAPPGSDLNSLAPPNSFTSSPPGHYTMKYPGVGIGNTHMQVTALGGASGTYCQLADLWMIASCGDVFAPVICFNNTGTPVDNLLFSSFASNL